MLMGKILDRLIAPISAATVTKEPPKVFNALSIGRYYHLSRQSRMYVRMNASSTKYLYSALLT